VRNGNGPLLEMIGFAPDQRRVPVVMVIKTHDKRTSIQAFKMTYRQSPITNNKQTIVPACNRLQSVAVLFFKKQF
jgi:hypothetical protein